MNKISVLLICGAGMSTGFMAANMRKAAKKRGMELSVYARSEAEVEIYADEADCIMLGPHLGYLEKELKERVAGKNVQVFVMSKSYYSILDGDAAIDDLLGHINK